MKKRAFKLALLGMPIGLSMMVIITVLISLKIGDGAYHAAAPGLVEDFGSEIAAVAVQSIVCMIYGAVLAVTSVIWQKEWSMMKKMAIHFALISSVNLPVVRSMRWIDTSAVGILKYFGLFTAAYAIIYGIMYIVMRKNLKKINAGLN